MTEDVRRKARGKSRGVLCCVYGCSNRGYDKNGDSTNIHFFKIPKQVLKNKELKDRWCSLIKRQDGMDGFNMAGRTVICDQHFTKADIKIALNSKMWSLKPWVEPSIFVRNTPIDVNMKKVKRSTKFNPDLNMWVEASDQSEDDDEISSENCETVDSLSTTLDDEAGSNIQPNTKPGTKPANQCNNQPTETGTGKAVEMPCKHCEKIFMGPEALKFHTEQMHPEKCSTRCPLCTQEVTDLAELFVHFQWHSTQIPESSLTTGSGGILAGEKDPLGGASTVFKQTIKSECRVCGKTGFQSEDELKKHLKQYHNGAIGTCFICSKMFYTNDEILEHLQRKHPVHYVSMLQRIQEISALSFSVGVSTYPCEYCPLNFADLESLVMHRENVHKQMGISAPQTSTGTTSKAEETVLCAQCNAPFSSIYNLAQHVHQVHGYSVNTQTLSSLTKSRSRNSLEHLNGLAEPGLEPRALSTSPRVSHAVNTSPAPKRGLHVISPNGLRIQTTLGSDSMECLSTPSSQSSSEFGLGRRVTGNDVSLRCTICHIEMPDTLSLRLHESAHMLDTSRADVKSSPSRGKLVAQWRCDLCNASFPDMAGYMTHCTTVHLGESSSHPWRCDLCNASFADMTNYVTHCNSVHLGESSPLINGHMTPPTMTYVTSAEKAERYSCSECAVRFTSLQSLEAHAVQHYLVVSKEYSCTSCDKMFKVAEELQSHLVENHAFQIYKCALCEEIVQTRVSLQVHMKVKHSSETQSFSCAKCHLTFRSEMSWLLHLRVDHLSGASGAPGGRTSAPQPPPQYHCCIICQARFDTDDQLQSHVSTHTKPFPCHLCRDSFHVEFLRDKHLQEKHADSAADILDSSAAILNSSAAILNSSAAILESRAVNGEERGRPEVMNVTSGALRSPGKKHSALRTALQPKSTDPPARRSLHPTTPSPRTPSSSPQTCDICDEKLPNEKELFNHKATTHKLGTVSEKMYSDAPRVRGLSPAPGLHREGGSGGGGEGGVAGAGEEGGGAGREASASATERSILSGLSVKEQHAFARCTDIIRLLGLDKRSELCYYCHQGFNSTLELEKHIASYGCHNNQKCNICDKMFATVNVLAEHKLTHCKVVRGDVCVVCRLVLRDEEHFYIHLQEHGMQGNTMMCIVCRQTLNSIYELQLHGRAHFSPTLKTYSCSVCRRILESTNDFVCKLNANGEQTYICHRCHAEQSYVLFSCTKCHAKFSSKDKLEAHMTTHKQMFQCIKCQQSFDSEYEIQLHVASHMLAEGNHHWCYICSQNFESPAKLQCHLIEHSCEDGQYKCNVCNVIVENSSTLQAHVLKHSLTTRPYKCTLCPQSFFFLCELLNHIHGTHDLASKGSGEKKGAFSCSECTQSFTSMLFLNQHKKFHDNLKDSTLKCTRCPLTFNLFAEVHAHFSQVHESERIDPPTSPPSLDSRANTDEQVADPVAPPSEYTCQQCDVTYTCLQEYEAHVQNNNDVHTCPSCHKTFSKRESMRAHMKCHTNLKPFRCSQCTQTFASKTQCRTHEETHNASQTSCNICGKTFDTCKDLWRHQVIMHNLKSGHTCHVCNSTFSDARDLESHMIRVHSLEKTSWSVKDKNGHRCVVCNSPYKSLKDLEFHVQQFHGMSTNDSFSNKSSLNNENSENETNKDHVENETKGECIENETNKDHVENETKGEYIENEAKRKKQTDESDKLNVSNESANESESNELILTDVDENPQRSTPKAKVIEPMDVDTNDDVKNNEIILLKN